MNEEKMSIRRIRITQVLEFLVLFSIFGFPPVLYYYDFCSNDYLSRRIRIPFIHPRQPIVPVNNPNQQTIIPTGRGDTQTVQMGFRGSWQMDLPLAGSVNLENGMIMRFLKNVSRIADEVMSGKLGIRSDGKIIQSPETIKFGKVYLVNNQSEIGKAHGKGYFLTNKERDLFLEIAEDETGKNLVVTVFVLPAFLTMEDTPVVEKPLTQQDAFRRTLVSGEILSIHKPFQPTQITAGGVSGIAKAKVILLPPGIPSDHPGFADLARTQYEEYLLKMALEEKGVKVYGFKESREGNIIKIENEYEEEVDVYKIANDNINIVIIHLSPYSSGLEYVAKRIKQIRDAHLDTYIIIEGMGTSFAPEQVAVLSEADAVIRGEGNSVLPILIEILGNSKPSQGLTIDQIQRLNTINGLYFRGKNSIVVNNFDILNSVTSSELKLPPPNIKYGLWIGDSPFLGGSTLLTSFGCPFACPFCHLGLVNAGVRMISAQQLIEWLKGYNAIGGKIVMIADDNFLLNRNRIMEFIGLLRKEGLDNKFNFRLEQTSIDTLIRNGMVDLELIRALKSIGVSYIGFGTDGLTDQALSYLKVNQLGKQRYTINDVIKLVETLETEKIKSDHFVILSNPKTTMEDLVESVLNWLILPINWRRTGFMSSRAMPTFGTVTYDDYAKVAGRRVSFEPSSFTWRDETGLVATWNGNWLMRPQYPEFGFFDPWEALSRRPPPDNEVRSDKYDDLFGNPFLKVADVLQAYLHPLTEFLIGHLDILDRVTQDTTKPAYQIKRKFYEILKKDGPKKAIEYLLQVNPYASRILDW
ncbi:MAG: radical SAM protein [Candidatus Jordarchaeaceae archaeon]